MSRYTWHHNSPLVRAHVGERIEDGDEFEPNEAELKAFGDRLEKVPEPAEPEPGESDDEPEPETDASESEDGYSKSELEDMDWDELRELAVNYDGDEVNGKSSKDEIIEFFAE